MDTGSIILSCVETKVLVMTYSIGLMVRNAPDDVKVIMQSTLNKVESAPVNEYSNRIVHLTVEEVHRLHVIYHGIVTETKVTVGKKLTMLITLRKIKDLIIEKTSKPLN